MFIFILNVCTVQVCITLNSFTSLPFFLFPFMFDPILLGKSQRNFYRYR